MIVGEARKHGYKQVYAVDAPNTAFDVASETVAALAASSMAFRSMDPGYSETLLRNAINVFQFADSYRGAYSDNDNVMYGACPYYCDFDGYQDYEKKPMMSEDRETRKRCWVVHAFVKL
ncbi:hypothetical protein RIF29_24036 [Crotalaria pallida]|uniref:cellulase n=1 Tax=Crotalaria pallida TaxID=3830 RepID=A0AAN9HW67_CROPI